MNDCVKDKGWIEIITSEVKNSLVYEVVSFICNLVRNLLKNSITSSTFFQMAPQLISKTNSRFYYLIKGGKLSKDHSSVLHLQINDPKHCLL